LIDQGLLVELDLDLLESMCEIQAMLYDARAQIKKFGSVLVSDQGGFYQNPHVAIANRCEQQLTVLRDRFGMGPAARPRVRTATPPPVEEKPAANDISRFFRREWEDQEKEELLDRMDGKPSA
jgi:P27 family predicted phage terminase small subunit